MKYLSKFLCSLIATCTIGSIFAGWLIKGPVHKMPPHRVPIFYTNKYNIGLLGIEKLHPFDTKKFKKAHQHIQKWLSTNYTNSSINWYFTSPVTNPVSNEDLRKVHTDKYLKSLYKSSTLANITGIGPLHLVPNFILRKALLKPMGYATQGSILASQEALKKGWAVNLGGGYHHARNHKGDGFCVYSDIPLAIKKLWERNPELTVMIIDTDAHQGDGHEYSLKVHENFNDKVYIFDIYNEHAYPRAHGLKKHIDCDVPVANGTATEEYLNTLQNNLDHAFKTFRKNSKNKPDLIIYNAGTDPYEKDQLGGLNVSFDGMIKRDEMVFKKALDNNIPIAMLTSGGYSSDSWKLIAESVENVIETFDLLSTNK